MKYDIGDVVKTKQDVKNPCRVGVITGIDAGAAHPYKVTFNEESIWYNENSLEAFDPKKSIDYNAGLCDGWELAREVFSIDSQDLLYPVFGEKYLTNVFREFTVEEVLEKIEAYKKKIEEEKTFKVGDEVEFFDQYDRPTKGCVVGFYDRNTVSVADKNGDIEEWGKDKLTKTGTHYDEIEKVFKQLDDDMER